MSDAVELTGQTFDATVKSGVTLIDFWAQWCAPCLMMAPTLDELGAEYAGKATVAKVNCDTEGDLAQKFSVAAIPCLIIMKDGEEVKRFVGVTSKAVLAAGLDENLA